MIPDLRLSRWLDLLLRSILRNAALMPAPAEFDRIACGFFLKCCAFSIDWSALSFRSDAVNQRSSVEERRKQWNFMMTDDGWIWRLIQPDGTEQTSRAFKTLKECTEDAAEHGYVVWKPEAERRRNT